MKDATKVAIALAFAGGAYLLSATSKPKWIDDILIRAYSPDHMVDQGTSAEEKARFEQAADISSHTGLPVGWVIGLLKAGATLAEASKAADEVVDTMISLGPPTDTLPKTLANYRDKVLAIVAQGFNDSST